MCLYTVSDLDPFFKADAQATPSYGKKCFQNASSNSLSSEGLSGNALIYIVNIPLKPSISVSPQLHQHAGDQFAALNTNTVDLKAEKFTNYEVGAKCNITPRCRSPLHTTGWNALHPVRQEARGHADGPLSPTSVKSLPVMRIRTMPALGDGDTDRRLRRAVGDGVVDEVLENDCQTGKAVSPPCISPAVRRRRICCPVAKERFSFIRRAYR